jgi:hypothetical protein
MKLSPDIKLAFEPYLTLPPVKTRALKGRVSDRLAQVADPSLARLGRQVEGLLGGISRKTSPFYLRLIHGAAQLYLRDDRAQGPAGLALDEQVVGSVVHALRRYDLLEE